jgi:hypothetical protein
MAEPLVVTMHTGLILTVRGDTAIGGKFGTPIDPALLCEECGVTLITLDMHHYQIKKLFGIGKQGDAAPNRWVRYLKMLRERAMSDALTLAATKDDAEADLQFKPSQLLKRCSLFGDIPELITIALPTISDAIRGVDAKVRKNSRHNSEIIIECSEEVMAYLINAMFDNPPAAESTPNKRDCPTSPFADYPHVKIMKNSRAGTTLCVKPTVDGKIKQITRTINHSAILHPDGGVSAQLQVAAELEGIYMGSHSTKQAALHPITSDVAEGKEEVAVEEEEVEVD